jgi:hypothetical protein
MNPTSSLVTGGVTFSAGTLVPLVTWGLTGFHTPIPESVPYLIAAAIITVAHAVYNRFGGNSTGPK